MEVLQNNIIFLQIASLVLSLIYINRFKSKQYYFFIFYLVSAIVADAIGGLINESSDAWIYNIYTFFEYSSMAGIYYFLNNKSLSKKVVLYVSILFYLIYSISFIYTPLQRYTVIILHFFVIPFLFLYFQELLNSKNITNYKKQLFFWITVGLLIYYFGTLPFITLSFIGELRNKILWNIPAVILIIMHLIFMVSFICMRRTQKS